MSEKERFVAVVKKVEANYRTTLTAGDLENFKTMIGNWGFDAWENAIIAHMFDPSVGQFFPSIAHVAKKIGNGSPSGFWIDAAEAWARQPKDESESGAVCNEMIEAWGAAEALYISGDNYGARTAYVATYNRLVSIAAMDGRQPNWFASLGFDKEQHYKAETETVKYNNLQLPQSERKALPSPPVKSVPLTETISKLPGKMSKEDREVAIKNIKKLREALQ